MAKTPIRYALPSVGNIELEFYGKASELYELLNKEGEINRLKSLNQLGLLEKVFPGAHHTRWEYIVLQLYLLKEFKDNLPGRGFSVDIEEEFGFDFKFSATEAIQMFVLLQNYGHLNGTFETECLVLEMLSKNTDTKNRLINLLPEDFKPWGTEVIENEKKLEFFKVLSVLFVEHSKDFKNMDELRKLCLKILKGFYLKTSEKLSELYEKIKLIRDIAYIYLDLNYVSVGFNIALPTILLSAREFAKKILNQDSRFYRFTMQIRDYLNEAVYLSPDAAWCLLEAKKKIGPKVSKKLNGFTRSQKLWVEYLEGLKREGGIPLFSVEKRPPFFILQLQSHIFDETLSVKKPITYINGLCRKLTIDKCSLSHIISLANAQTLFYFFRSIEECALAKSYYELLGELCSNEEKTLKPFHSIKGIDKLFGFKLFQKSFDSVFKSFLYMLTDENYDINIEPMQLGVSSIISSNKTKAKKYFEYFSSLDFIKHLSKARKNELDCIKYILDKIIVGGRTGICLNRIKFGYRERFTGAERSNIDAKEIDGIIVESNKRSTKFYIIEAKDQQSGGISAAKSQLEKLKSELKINTLFRTLISAPSEIPGKGAFITIKLSPRGKNHSSTSHIIAM